MVRCKWRVGVTYINEESAQREPQGPAGHHRECSQQTNSNSQDAHETGCTSLRVGTEGPACAADQWLARIIFGCMHRMPASV
jgi:hypothetical protein